MGRRVGRGPEGPRASTAHSQPAQKQRPLCGGHPNVGDSLNGSSRPLRPSRPIFSFLFPEITRGGGVSPRGVEWSGSRVVGSVKTGLEVDEWIVGVAVKVDRPELVQYEVEVGYVDARLVVE